MPKVYNAADLFLFPSHQETFGLAAAEAAAAGLPVIFRDLPVYETLHNGDYCRAAQTSDFIALTKRLMKDTQFYDEIQTVSQMLTEPFEPARIHEQLISLYKTVSTDSP
jgi:glycosyltransferase involved in cell wall biosynthesis